MNEVSVMQSQESVVCVVDGDPAVRDSLQYLCDSNGYPALGFATRAAFLRGISEPVSVRCVICEAQLPDGTGFDLYSELRARGLQIPFALMVSRRSIFAAQRANRAGIEYVWPKPLVDRDPLIAFLGAQTQ